MSAPTDRNSLIALAKGWTWDTEVVYILTKKPVPYYVKGMDEPIEYEETRWLNPEGEPAMRPDFVGTLEGVSGLMRELNDWAKRRWISWTWRPAVKLYYAQTVGDDFTSEPDHPGDCVGDGWLSVFRKEAADASTD